MLIDNCQPGVKLIDVQPSALWEFGVTSFNLAQPPSPTYVWRNKQYEVELTDDVRLELVRSLLKDLIHLISSEEVDTQVNSKIIKPQIGVEGSFVACCSFVHTQKTLSDQKVDCQDFVPLSSTLLAAKQSLVIVFALCNQPDFVLPQVEIFAHMFQKQLLGFSKRNFDKEAFEWLCLKVQRLFVKIPALQLNFVGEDTVDENFGAPLHQFQNLLKIALSFVSQVGFRFVVAGSDREQLTQFKNHLLLFAPVHQRSLHVVEPWEAIDDIANGFHGQTLFLKQQTEQLLIDICRTQTRDFIIISLIGNAVFLVRDPQNAKKITQFQVTQVSEVSDRFIDLIFENPEQFVSLAQIFGSQLLRE